MIRNFILLLFIVKCVAISEAQVIYVKYNAAGLNNGSSWTSAYRDLRKAFAVATPGQEIWVAEGQYSPLVSWDIGAYNTLDLPSGVKLYGGFAGNETKLEDRDWTQHITQIGESNQNLIYCENTDSNTVIDGFLFRNGSALIPDWLQKQVFCQDDPNESTCYGGGIYLYSAANTGPAFLTVRNCTFIYNVAKYGGAIAARLLNGGGGGLRLEHCYFGNNTSGPEGFGGAVYIETGKGPTFDMWIDQCEFYSNKALWNVAAANIFNFRESINMEIKNCYFHENKSNHSGGAMGISSVADGIIVENCLFEKNMTAPSFSNQSNGSGALGGIGFKVNNCRFIENQADIGGVMNAGNIVVSNCIFFKNKAKTYGGVIRSFEHNYFINNTFINNYSGISGSIVQNINNALDTFINCVFWNNTTGLASGGLSFSLTNPKAKAYLDYCFFDKIDPGAFIDGYNGATEDSTLLGHHNIFSINDPMWVDTSLNNFRPVYCSPLVNQGSNAWVEKLGLQSDLDATPRIKNNRVDIGAYETEGFALTYQKQDIQCPGEATGSITLSYTGGTAPYHYQWENQLDSNARYMLPAGDYAVTIYDAALCSDSATITLNAPKPFEVYTTVSDASAVGVSDGGIRIDSITGGTPAYTGQWVNNTGGWTLTDLLPGNYYYHLTDANGCDTIFQFKVNVTTKASNLHHTSLKIALLSNPGAQPAMQFETVQSERVNISISDAAGRLWLYKNLQISEGKSIYQVPDPLRPGIYFILVSSAVGDLQSFKWVAL